MQLGRTACDQIAWRGGTGSRLYERQRDKFGRCWRENMQLGRTACGGQCCTQTAQGRVRSRLHVR